MAHEWGLASKQAWRYVYDCYCMYVTSVARNSSTGSKVAQVKQVSPEARGGEGARGRGGGKEGQGKGGGGGNKR